MIRLGCGLLYLLVSCSLIAAERTALVIGNSAYEIGRLANPVNDATDIAAALRALDFEVTLATDLDRAGMLEKLNQFRQSISPGGLALVYYSGHGAEADGENWLLPVSNRAIHTQAQVRIHSVSAQDVLRTVEEAGARLNVLILDACRDNPLPAAARSASRGLKAISTGSASFVAYSTSPGSTAADGDGRNSPYTEALLKVLGGQRVTIPDLFNQAGTAVVEGSEGRQVPWNSSTPIWPPIELAIDSQRCPNRNQLGASIEAEEVRVECEVEREASFQAYEIGKNGEPATQPSRRFKLGTRVALCVTLSEPLYFSVWDAPPRGEVERLYPNSKSHPGSSPAAVRAGPNIPTCLGLAGSGYKIMIDPKEGSGRGQFYLVATRTLQSHPAQGDFVVADWKKVYASIEPEDPGKTDGGGKTLFQDRPGVADTMLDYEVY